MAKKDEVVKGLDPDLFEASLSDDEPDNEEEEEAEESEDDSSEEADFAEEADDAAEEADAEAEDDGSDDNEEEGEEENESTEAEEPEAEPESEVATATPAAEEKVEEPPKRRRGRPPKKPRSDAEAEASTLASSYEVQRGFTAIGGKTYHPGDVIPIKCKHCALWEREWLGKKRCSAGRRLDEDTVMHADRFSCGTFFICKEYEAELSTFLNMSLPEILTVRSMLPGIKKILSTADFLNRWAERHNHEEDLREVFKNAKGFVMSFGTLEQLALADGFIRQYAQVASQKARPKRPPKPKFESGDWVEWTDLGTRERIEGLILSIARGNIILAGVKAQKGQKFTYKYKEWKKTRNPQITKKTADPE
jgi:hypothetical protein